MKLFVGSCLLLFLVFLAVADSLPVMSRDWVLKPQAIPTVATDIGALVIGGVPTVNTTLSVCQLDIIAAPGSSAINITIRDNQVTPVYFIQAVPITPTSATQGTTWPGVIRASAPVGCKLFIHGMTIQASATGAYIAASGRW